MTDTIQKRVRKNSPVADGFVKVNGLDGAGVRISVVAAMAATLGARFFNFTNPPTMPDPTCQGSILRLSTTSDSNVSRLIHANAAHASSRANMTLRMVSSQAGQRTSRPVRFVQ